MSVPQGQLIEAITAALSRVPERYPGYRKDLKTTLVEVVQLERQHAEAHIDIKVRIKDQCAAAGDQLYQRQLASRSGDEAGHVS